MHVHGCQKCAAMHLQPREMSPYMCCYVCSCHMCCYACHNVAMHVTYVTDVASCMSHVLRQARHMCSYLHVTMLLCMSHMSQMLRHACHMCCAKQGTCVAICMSQCCYACHICCYACVSSSAICLGSAFTVSMDEILLTASSSFGATDSAWCRHNLPKSYS